MPAEQDGMRSRRVCLPKCHHRIVATLLFQSRFVTHFRINACNSIWRECALQKELEHEGVVSPVKNMPTFEERDETTDSDNLIFSLLGFPCALSSQVDFLKS